MPAPQVDDQLAVHGHRDRRADVAVPAEVGGEGVLDRREVVGTRAARSHRHFVSLVPSAAAWSG